MHSLTDNVIINHVLYPQVISTLALNGSHIQTLGAEDITIIVSLGQIEETLDSTHHIAFKLEHSDDDGEGSPASYAACTIDHIAGVSSVTSGVFYKADTVEEQATQCVIRYTGGKAFCRVVATPTGLTEGGPVAAVVIKSNLSQKPPAA